jgi:hypothetical protein
MSPRRVLTSASSSPIAVAAPPISISWYDDRGTSENWIKGLKLDSHADRLSCHRFRANAFPLQLHSVALLLQ